MTDTGRSLLSIYRLGRVGYERAYRLQERLLEARLHDQIPDTLVLLEHDPVITLGRGAKEAHLLVERQALSKRGIDVFEVNRGGDVTYHGPGQLVAYPIIDLGASERDVRRYVWRLEEVMIRVAAHFGLNAGRIAGLNGAWIENKKIGAVGVRIDHWVTMHGFAINVNTDLTAFDLIVPCGIADRQVTSLSQQLGRTIEMDAVTETTAEQFMAVFQKNPTPGQNLNL
jgi:lipoyl(octanoyl) transferase